MRRFLMLCALAAACSGDPTRPAQDPPVPPGPPGPPNPVPGTSVDVQDDFFTPAERSVKVGETVQWTWRGGSSHSVTFPGGPSSQTQSRGTFERTFNSTGNFTYFCTVHGASMSGAVTVTN